MEEKTYKEIICEDLKHAYKYCEEDFTIYKDDNEAPLFNLYDLFVKDMNHKQFPTEMRLEICKKVIYAYEYGRKDKKKEIADKMQDFLGLNNTRKE